MELTDIEREDILKRCGNYKVSPFGDRFALITPSGQGRLIKAVNYSEALQIAMQIMGLKTKKELRNGTKPSA